MSSTDRSFGERRTALPRIPVDQYEYYDSLAEQENLDLGPWIVKELAEHRGLPIPNFVGRHQRRRRAEHQEDSSNSAA